jgi:hypothetical protein
MESPCPKCEGNTIPVHQMLIKPGFYVKSLFNENSCKANGIIDPYCPGFVFTSSGVSNGTVQAGYKKHLKMSFELITDGYVELDLSLKHLSDKEEFSFKLNDKEEKFTNISEVRDRPLKVSLGPGIYELEFTFINNGSNVTQENVVINKIVIDGTTEGTITKCFKCPGGSTKVKSDNLYKCIKCPSGYTLSNGKCAESNVTCPAFTYKLNNSCNLDDIVHNKEYGLRYNIMDLKENVERHCTNDNELCDGKFFGPIKDVSTNNIYYISFATREKINLSDFFYTTDKDYIDNGHVFMLKNGVTNSSKVLQNMGRSIESVKLIPYVNDNPYFKKPGILISYTEGELCDAHEGKHYRSYIFIYCTKLPHSDSPKLYKQDDCTFIFEWENYQICPFCLKSNIKPINVK